MARQYFRPDFTLCGQKAEELNVPLFIHPTGIPELAKKLAGNGFLTNTIGYPLETTIALSPHIFEGISSIAFRSLR